MIKISLLILSLLQVQPTRIPKLVWAGAIVIFLGGISMLIYFLTRLKKGEKEQEEDDWRTARRSLFVEPAKPAEPVERTESAEATPAAPNVAIENPTEVVSQSWADAAPPSSIPENDEVVVPVSPEPTEASVSSWSEPPPTALHEPPPIAVPEPPPPALNVLPVDQPELNPATKDEERGTQLLGSEPPPVADEGVVLSDDVWAELDRNQTAPPSEPLPVARVEQRAGRETFEPPAIRPLTPRAPFEAPQIERIVPRNATPSIDESSRRMSSLPPQPPTPEPDLPTRRLAAPDAASESSVGAVRVGAAHKPAGSVLGLPAESSRGPLILGERQQRADVGIGGLSNYGKEIGPEGGRGGMVALALTILIVGGGTLSYLFLPSVHARVDSVVSRLRGEPPPGPPAPPPPQPKAQIVGAVSEAVKNVVKAKGKIYNVSTEPLENLSLEVGLYRTEEGDPDTRIVPVIPNRLEPAQQGRFEFEYDGSKATGYPSGYKPLRLLSKGEEVAFTRPGQRSQ